MKRPFKPLLALISSILHEKQKSTKYIFVLTTLFLGVITPALAQQKITLESLAPPAPNSAELGKYGAYPVGTLTGIPEISFPLYEITSGKLKLPISLSYHASGVQVNQKSTDVGLGWSVMAGGTISRTVYGSPDDSPYGYFNYTPPSYNTLMGMTNYYTMATYIGNPTYDLEPDLFTYNVAGKSGKFICQKNKSFRTFPFDPIVITKSGPTNNVVFQIVDDNGNIYNFNQFSKTSSESNTGFIGPRSTVSSWYLTSITSADGTDNISFVYETTSTTDVLENQVWPFGYAGVPDPNTNSTPSFVNGGTQKNVSTMTYNELLIKQINFKNGHVQFNRNTVRKDVDGSNANSLDEMLVYNAANQVIKKITFNHDYYNASPFTDYWTCYRLKLTGFTESDPGMTINKTYSFGYDNTPLPPYGSYSIDYWGFYNGATNQGLIPTTTVYGSDLNSVSFMNANYTNPLGGRNLTYTVGNANREPSASFMQAGILNKITYPTGGNSQFAYEPHQYLSDGYTTQLIVKGGMTRGISKSALSSATYSFTVPSDPSLAVVNQGTIVSNISINFSPSNIGNTEFGETQLVTLKDVTANRIIRTWKHDGDLTVALNVNEQLSLSSGESYVLENDVYGDNTVFINSSINWTENTNQHPIKIGGGLRVQSIKHFTIDNVLSKEENYVYGTAENNLGVKLFDERNFYKNYEDVVNAYYIGITGTGSACVLYDGSSIGVCWQRNFLGFSKYNSMTYLGSPILYPTVTKYEGNPVTNIGKTVFNYNINIDPISFPAEFINSGNYGSINNAWSQGELTDETAYKYSGGQYTPVEKKQYEYTTYNFTRDTGIMIKQFKQFIKLMDCFTNTYGPESGATSQPGNGFFSIFPYTVKSGASKMTKETKTIYDQLNVSNTISTVTSHQYQNSSNLYPTEVDLTASDGTTKITRLKYPQDMSDPVSLAMVSKNILSPPLEEKLLKSVSGTETLLSTTQTAYKQIGNLIVRDNIKASTGSNAPETRIVFNQYDSNNGNILEQQKVDGPYEAYQWGYNGEYPVARAVNAGNNDIFYDSFEEGNGNSTLNDSKTGHYSHTGTYAKSLTGLSGGNYTLTYWQKSGSAWSLVSLPIMVSGSTYTIGASPAINGQIDDVRFYPATAQMTTYTYDPLIGMTSSTDAKGNITYYEYDSFQRLMNIKDNDGNVVKHMDYHYQGQ